MALPAAPAPVRAVPEALADGPRPPGGRLGRILSWLAVAGILGSIAVMVAVCAGGGWPDVAVGRPAGPPWVLGPHIAQATAVIAVWAAAACGAGGVAAGLAAVARGARVPVRLLLGVVLVAIAALVVLPPAGSTDSLDYAAYGRIAELGHSPYLMSPRQLGLTGDPIGRITARVWGRHVSVYGPLATAEQLAAARLGGTSLLRVTFWLKLWNALAFGAVALVAGRMLRADPARQARAHLLWTANPLLIWALIAGAHVDAVAAALGFLGLAAAARRPGARSPRWRPALAAGLLVGAAAAVKINYVVFAVALAWPCRRSAAGLAAAVAGVAAVVVPSYLWSGLAALHAVLARTGHMTVDSGYVLLFGWGHRQSAADLLLTVLACVAVAVALLLRPPPGCEHRPAARLALLVSLAWLLIWPYQLPWYDAMVFCLLVLCPASRLDWLVLARLFAGTVALMTPLPLAPGARPLHETVHWVVLRFAPVMLLAVLAVTIGLAVSGRWAGRPGRDGQPPPGPVPQP